MKHPYQSLPLRNFWRSGVVDLTPLQLLGELYRKRFDIHPDSFVATAGSCFAQRLTRHLRRRFNFVDTEPAPPRLPRHQHERFGYGVYSARYGNIYSSGHLRQLIAEAVGQFDPVEDVWESEGRFYDPFRPSIEPDGFGSAGEVRALRATHLKAVKEAIRRSDVFVFTLGLTETWRSTLDGAVYPACPGTVAGSFDPSRHVFKNTGFADVLQEMLDFIGIARVISPSIKFILSVSPVPLIATATDQHVLSAATYSKSVLRAVCGELCAYMDYVDYFPSYEMITAVPMRGMFYESNLRTVSSEGVDFVMSHFLSQHPGKERPAEAPYTSSEIEAICDEEALEKLRGQS